MAHSTHEARKIDGTPVTEVLDEQGNEVTGVWIEDGLTYWEDPFECTVRTGTPYDFAIWLASHLDLG